MKNIVSIIVVIVIIIIIGFYYNKNVRVEANKETLLSDPYVDGGLRIFASLSPEGVPVIKYVKIQHKKVFGYQTDKDGIIISVNKEIFPAYKIGQQVPAE